MSLNVKLVVVGVGGDVKTTELTLRLPSTIGRGRGTAIILPHPLVSRQHCELFESDGQLMVRDLGSLNGTFVNNQRITESLIAPGELLTVGTVTFRAVYEIEGALPPSQTSTLKGPSSEKTVHATKATTRAAPKKPAPKPAAPAPADSDPLEFDFGTPLLDDASPSAPGGPAHVTERLETPPPDGKSSKPGGKKNAKPSEKSSDKNRKPAKDTDDEIDEKAASSSDDDLNDFLESLGDK